jgi:DNA-directed RNA polymerase subunit RPC12/RpoP
MSDVKSDDDKGGTPAISSGLSSCDFCGDDGLVWCEYCGFFSLYPIRDGYIKEVKADAST